MKRPLLICAGVFVLGEVLGLYQNWNGETAIVGFFIIVFLVFNILMILLRGISRFYLLMPLLFFIGFVWAMRTVYFDDDVFGEESSAYGVVTWIEKGNYGNILYLTPNSLLENETLLVYLSEDFDGAIGNVVYLEGTIESFSVARNPGEFDSHLYYAARQIGLRMYGETISVVREDVHVYRNGLYKIKSHCSTVLDRICDSDDGELFKAILLGDKRGIADDIKELYQKSGIIHLLAISGLHVSLLGSSIYKGLRRLGISYRICCSVSVFLVVSFGIMTGGGISILRAAWMFCIHMIAEYLGRTYDMLTAVGIAATYLFFENPMALLASGTQLSFMAVLGIGLGGQILSGFSGGSRLGRTLAVSLGIQLFTLPLCLYHFFEYPRYGMLLNLMVIPLMPMIAASGVLGILGGMWQVRLGTFFIGVGHYGLELYQVLCQLFLNLPFSMDIIGRPSLDKLIIYYFILLFTLISLAFIKNYYSEKRVCRLVLPLCFLLLYGVSISWFRPAPVKMLEIRMIDVGQGDGILIRAPSGNYLIDGGSSDIKLVGKNRIVPYLKYLGITKIDGIFLSHLDADHLNGIVEILANEDKFGLEIAKLVVVEGTLADEAFADILPMVEEQDVVLEQLKRGDQFNYGDLVIECLYPIGAGEYSGGNDGSMVLHLAYRGFTALFTGDLEKAGESYLAGNGIGSYHLLKAGHHGSNTSSNQNFLDCIQPDITLISCGITNRYGHPHPNVIERLETSGTIIYQTAERGAITLKTDGVQVRIEGYLNVK